MRNRQQRWKLIKVAGANIVSLYSTLRILQSTSTSSCLNLISPSPMPIFLFDSPTHSPASNDLVRYNRKIITKQWSFSTACLTKALLPFLTTHALTCPSFPCNVPAVLPKSHRSSHRVAHLPSSRCCQSPVFALLLFW